MVCKRSLYCWKNGPCASDQTRKQIWEENIRFRESLRDLNQSDHYWSFQISKTRCLCMENENLSRKYRSASLHDIDCTSVAHDCNGLKFRNCLIHCPPLLRKNTEEKIQTKKETAVRHPFKGKSEENKGEVCHRYKNTLVNSKLKPSMKSKFLSQTNLNSINKSIERKKVHTSCENISNVKLKPLTKETKVTMIDSEVQTDSVKIKPKQLKPLSGESRTISRTTRKMLESKKTPFVTYGCNNSNLDIGSKRTHNVLASKMEVYPGALTAKQQKREAILKCLESEKKAQIPDGLHKRINHSSLWSVDGMKDSKALQKKYSKYLLPVMHKPVKKMSTQYEPGSCRTYRKPQIYFY